MLLKLLSVCPWPDPLISEQFGFSAKPFQCFALVMGLELGETSLFLYYKNMVVTDSDCDSMCGTVWLEKGFWSGNSNASRHRNAH